MLFIQSSGVQIVLLGSIKNTKLQKKKDIYIYINIYIYIYIYNIYHVYLI